MKTKKGLFKITSNATIAKHEHLSEVDFVRAYFNHKNWIYQPACFSRDMFLKRVNLAAKLLWD